MTLGFPWIFGLVTMYCTNAAAAFACFVCEVTIHSPPPIEPVTCAPLVATGGGYASITLVPGPSEPEPDG